MVMREKGMTQFKVIQCMCVYQYLKENCVGKDKAISGIDLCEKMCELHPKYFFEGCTKVMLQDIVKHLRRNDIPEKYITRRIGSSPSGYWLETKEGNGIEFLKKLAVSHIQTAIKSGVSISYFHQVLNHLEQEKLVEGQTRIPLRKSQENIIHIYSDDLLLEDVS